MMSEGRRGEEESEREAVVRDGVDDGLAADGVDVVDGRGITRRRLF